MMTELNQATQIRKEEAEGKTGRSRKGERMDLQEVGRRREREEGEEKKAQEKRRGGEEKTGLLHSEALPFSREMKTDYGLKSFICSYKYKS